MREKLPSRRRVALKRLAIAFVILLAINGIMHIGLLLPRQAVHQVEERNGTGWTRTVDRSWTPEVHKTHLVYLSQNEDVTLFSSTYFTLYGWMAGFGVALDCSEPAPLYAGASYMHRDGDEAWYFFGRVGDDSIERIDLVLYAEEYDDKSSAQTGREVRRIEDVELREQNGRRYFLVKDSGEWDGEKDGHSPRPVVVGYDAAGSVVAELPIEQFISSSFG